MIAYLCTLSWVTFPLKSHSKPCIFTGFEFLKVEAFTFQLINLAKFPKSFWDLGSALSQWFSHFLSERSFWFRWKPHVETSNTWQVTKVTILTWCSCSRLKNVGKMRQVCEWNCNDLQPRRTCSHSLIYSHSSSQRTFFDFDLTAKCSNCSIKVTSNYARATYLVYWFLA